MKKLFSFLLIFLVYTVCIGQTQPPQNFNTPVKFNVIQPSSSGANRVAVLEQNGLLGYKTIDQIAEQGQFLRVYEARDINIDHWVRQYQVSTFPNGDYIWLKDGGGIEIAVGNQKDLTLSADETSKIIIKGNDVDFAYAEYDANYDSQWDNNPLSIMPAGWVINRIAAAIADIPGGSQDLQETMENGSLATVTTPIAILGSSGAGADTYGIEINAASNVYEMYKFNSTTGSTGFGFDKSYRGIKVFDNQGDIGMVYDTDMSAEQILVDNAVPSVKAVKALINAGGGGGGDQTLQEIIDNGSTGVVQAGGTITLGAFQPGNTSASVMNLDQTAATLSSGPYTLQIRPDVARFRYNASDIFSIFEDGIVNNVVESYADETALRPSMGNSSIPSVGKVQDMIDAKAPQTLQQTLDAGRGATITQSNSGMLIASTGGNSPISFLTSSSQAGTNYQNTVSINDTSVDVNSSSNTGGSSTTNGIKTSANGVQIGSVAGFAGEFYHELYIPKLTTSTANRWSLPIFPSTTINRTLVGSVNGETADSTGNVNLTMSVDFANITGDPATNQSLVDYVASQSGGGGGGGARWGIEDNLMNGDREVDFASGSFRNMNVTEFSITGREDVAGGNTPGITLVENGGSLSPELEGQIVIHNSDFTYLADNNNNGKRVEVAITPELYDDNGFLGSPEFFVQFNPYQINGGEVVYVYSGTLSGYEGTLYVVNAYTYPTRINPNVILELPYYEQSPVTTMVYTTEEGALLKAPWPRFGIEDTGSGGNRTVSFNGSGLYFNDIAEFVLQGQPTNGTIPYNSETMGFFQTNQTGAPELDGYSILFFQTPPNPEYNNCINVTVNVDGDIYGQEFCLDNTGSGSGAYIAPEITGTSVTMVSYEFNDVQNPLVKLQLPPVEVTENLKYVAQDNTGRLVTTNGSSSLQSAVDGGKVGIAPYTESETALRIGQYVNGGNLEYNGIEAYSANLNVRGHAINIYSTTSINVEGTDFTTNIEPTLPESIMRQQDVDAKIEAIHPYKVYTALVTQSGSADPVVTVLDNTLGATITWARTNEGVYTGTASSAVFTENKTLLKPLSPSSTLTSNVFTVSTTSTVVLETFLSGDPADSVVNGGVGNNWIEIRVYN